MGDVYSQGTIRASSMSEAIEQIIRENVSHEIKNPGRNTVIVVGGYEEAANQIAAYLRKSGYLK